MWRFEGISDFLPCSRAPLGVITGYNLREAQEDTKLCSFTNEKMEARPSELTFVNACLRREGI